MLRDKWTIERRVKGLKITAVYGKLGDEGLYGFIGYVNNSMVDLMQVDDPMDHALRFINEQVMMHDPLPRRSSHDHTRRPRQKKR